MFFSDFIICTKTTMLALIPSLVKIGLVVKNCKNMLILIEKNLLRLNCISKLFVKMFFFVTDNVYFVVTVLET